MLTQDQVIALLNLLTNGKLISELTEQLTIDTDDNYLAINVGTSDAKKVKIPLLRGYKGTYDANTNTPSLVNGTGLHGDMYVVSVAGSRDFGAGNVDLLVDDIIIYLNGKYLKTNGISTGSLDLQGTYDNSDPKTIQLEDSTSGTLVIKDSSTNINRDKILEVLRSDGITSLFHVDKERVFAQGGNASPFQIKRNASGNTNTSIEFVQDDYSSYLGVNTSGDLCFNVSANLSSPKFRVERNGDVSISGSQHTSGTLGIGTETPSEKLEVNGNAKIDGELYVTSNQINSANLSVYGTLGVGTNNPLSKFTVQYSDGTTYDSTESEGQKTEGSTIMVLNTSESTDSFSQILFRSRNSSVGLSRIVSISKGANQTDLAFVTEDDNSPSEKMRVTSEGDLGVGTETPSEKLEVKGRVFINPDTQNIGTDKASAIVFQSTNFDGSASAKSRINSFNNSANKASMEFQVETGANTYHTAIVIDNFNNSGDVRVSIPGTIQVDETVLLQGGTYSQLPSSPQQGMFTYITDAKNVSYRATASGNGTEKCLVFYDGTNWVYH